MARRFNRVASRAFRIGVVLAIIISIPLAGVAWFSISAVRDAEAELSRVAEVQANVDELVALSDLRTRLLEERNWTAAADGIHEIGLTSDLVQSLVGVNLTAEAQTASAAVDQIVTNLGLVDVHTQLIAIRTAGVHSLDEASKLYVDLEQKMGSRSGVLFEQLLDDASSVRDGGEVLDTLRILEAGTSARQSIATEFNHYFGALFAQPAERQKQLSALANAEALRQNDLNKVTRLAGEKSMTYEIANKISKSADADRFISEINSIVARAFIGDSKGVPSTSNLGDLNDVASIFEASRIATDLYLNLVEAAGQDVELASQNAVHHAENRNNRAMIYLVGLMVASIAVGLGATRAIVQPLHGLAQGARRIRDGEPPRLNARGPVEVREAAWAIQEAGVQLDLATRQALALAEGDLNNPFLRDAGPGHLGKSLQAAVQNLAASLNEREEFRRRIAHEASHDGLTQLPNRNACIGQLEHGLARTARSATQLAVLFIDLDGFKRINDLHGHQAGDAVLRTTAQRLVATVRDGDHVGRLGGDEFVVIAEPIDSLELAIALAHRIIAAISLPIQEGNIHVTVAASIGIAISDRPGIDASELLHDADLAVYKAKAAGRGRLQVCDDQLRSEVNEKADLEHALKAALAHDEFILYYQPIVSSDEHEIVGHEALIRWNRPGHPLVAPDSFIPFAERSDLILAIDCWVIRSVAAQISDWDRANRPQLPVAINVSAKHLASPKFVDDILCTLADCGVDPSRIIVEVTESALLHDMHLAAAKLQTLKNNGIRVAIDDFGTGYTSLAHLRTLPFDILKIDRSFTNDPITHSLVKLIIDTGHLLGATVIAEGIEDLQQAERICSLGADELQGYYFGRPAPPSRLTELAVNTVDSIS